LSFYNYFRFFESEYECECECGQIFQGRARDIKNQKIISCGCKKKARAEQMGLANKKEEGLSSMNVIYEHYKHKLQNKEKVHNKNRMQMLENQVFGSYRKRDEKRSFDFTITKEEFKNLTKQNCEYCGAEPNNILKGTTWGYNGDYIYNGLDRVDSNKGYTLDNVVPCCKYCNFAKSDMTKEDFLSHMFKIYNHSISLLTSQTSEKEKEEIK
jgi:hypothetical protein